MDIRYPLVGEGYEMLQVGEEISQAWTFGRAVTSEMKRETASSGETDRQTKIDRGSLSSLARSREKEGRQSDKSRAQFASVERRRSNVSR